MKFFFTLLYFLLFLFASGQKKTEMFYDYNWKPCVPAKARFYSTVQKTDSGWFRNDYFLGTMHLQMRALFEDSACTIQNGYCFYFHANGALSVAGHMLHNKQEGVCVRYYSNGMMADSATYHNGVPEGNKIGWHSNGYMSDSVAHVNDSMDVHLGWFDNGSISFAGYLLYGKMYGKWKFYHRNGNLSAAEIYDKGIARSKEYYNEDGSLQPDTSKVNSPAIFKKGDPVAWGNYLGKNLYWPGGYRITNGDLAVVVVELTINEEGKAEDVEVVTPFHPDFDKIALHVIRNSPKWQPAIAHNRKVKSTFRQPVTFQQEE